MSPWSTLVAIASSTACAGAALAQSFTFVAFGDLPDRTPENQPLFERLVDEINKLSPAFSIHLGDLTNGDLPCSDETYRNNSAYFGSFDRPLIYTPGDNEWVDCYRPSAGRFDPQERLARLRTLFFADGFSQGREKMRLLRQSEDPLYPKFVENASFTLHQVQFSTVHVVGSNNNYQRTRAAAAEHAERNAANIAWTRKAFADAKSGAAKALVLAMHADVMFEEMVPDRRSGFLAWVEVLTAETIAFKRPVLLVHGDGHHFRADMPLRVGRDRTLVANFFRVEGFGAPDVGGVVVAVDPAAAAPFQFRPLVVPAPEQAAKQSQAPGLPGE